MKIEHLALWTPDLERLRAFCERFSGCVAGALYERAPAVHFVFPAFLQGARLELMHMPALDVSIAEDEEGHARVGLAHFALSVGSEAAVRDTTERLRAAGVRLSGEPRWTGDGCFESTVLDSDGNTLEITI